MHDQLVENPRAAWSATSPALPALVLPELGIHVFLEYLTRTAFAQQSNAIDEKGRVNRCFLNLAFAW